MLINENKSTLILAKMKELFMFIRKQRLKILVFVGQH